MREAGITRVEGGIIGHDDLFDDNGFGDGWTLDNLPYGYAAAVSALEYNEGSVDLVIRAGDRAGDPVVIQVRPEGGGLQIDNRLVTVAESGTGHAHTEAPARLVTSRRAGTDSGESGAVRAHGLGGQSDGFFCVRVSRRAGG